jgi:hypothetical protein
VIDGAEQRLDGGNERRCFVTQRPAIDAALLSAQTAVNEIDEEAQTALLVQPALHAGLRHDKFHDAPPSVSPAASETVSSHWPTLAPSS